MPIKVTCTNCGGVLHAPDDAGGKRGRCPTCGNVLPIPADAPRLPPASGESPAKASRSGPSFGDFNTGSQAAASARPTPAGAPLPFADDSPASARSSVPSLAEPTVSPRRGRPAPAALPSEDRRRPNDPFARTATGKVEGEVTDKLIRKWKKVRGGFWWVRVAIPFLLLPILALNGLKLYEHFIGAVPVKDPGYSGQSWLTSQQEFEIVAVMAPFVLGVLLLMMGRFGVASAPHRAKSRGLALFSALATLLVVCSCIAVAMPVVALLALGEQDLPIVVRTNGVAEWRLMLPGDAEGIMQRLGLLVGASAFILAEFWFASALGRLGTALNSDRLAARATRYLVVLGLIVAGLVATGALTPAYNFGEMPREVSSQTNKFVRGHWNEQAEPQLDKVGNFRTPLRAGAFILGGLLVAGIYWRLAGAGRGAVKDWIDQNERP